MSLSKVLSAGFVAMALVAPQASAEEWFNRYDGAHGGGDHGGGSGDYLFDGSAPGNSGYAGVRIGDQPAVCVAAFDRLKSQPANVRQQVRGCHSKALMHEPVRSCDV